MNRFLQILCVGLVSCVFIGCGGAASSPPPKMDGKMDKMDGKMDKMDGKMDKMDGKMDKMDGKMEKK